MKIFSLQSKKTLLIWAIFLGLAVNIALSLMVRDFSKCVSFGEEGGPICVMRDPSYTIGWPLHVSFQNSLYTEYNIFTFFSSSIFYFNLLFWVLISFLFLSLIKFEKEKSIHKKIFSLQSKWYLVGWSLVVGFVIALLFEQYLHVVNLPAVDCSSANLNCYEQRVSFPFYHFPGETKTDSLPFDWLNALPYPYFFLNFAFWTLAVFIFLSLIKYFFKKKPNQILQKT